MAKATYKAPGFYITNDKGFHIVFENGYTASVQFGPANYCAHYDRRIGKEERACGQEGSETAEVYSFAPDGKPAAMDDVEGYQTPAQVLALINMIASKE